jgi:hypothetical protein
MASLWGAGAGGQQLTRRGGGAELYPRLPGAVTRAPDGLGSTPFDINKFFAAPPRAQNAAPLYLDAFFEFSEDMAICFPEGTERERRRLAAAERSKRYLALSEALAQGAKAVPGAAIDEVVKLYDTGFQKLAEAQRRERCVFEPGVSFDTLTPLAQGARQAIRIAALKVRRAAAKKDFDGAIREVAAELRLARDLQPRGDIMVQLVHCAITRLISVQILEIVVAPEARAEHCDRLIKLMTQHESKMTNGYVEALRAEYVAVRLTVRDLTRHQSDFGKRLGVKPGESVVEAFTKMLSQGAPLSRAGRFPDNVDTLIARTTTTDMTRKIRELDRFYSALLSMDGVPYADRIVKVRAVTMADGADALSHILFLLTPAVENVTRAIAQATASFRATECLLALRRWQLTGHRGAPANMASLVAAAGLKAVPTDPYDGKPMRLATVDGKPMIYSVGTDGKDDGGQKDSNLDQRPTGDLIFRLPAPDAPG